MGWNRVAHPTEGSPRRGLHGVPAILCGVNAVKDARRLLYLSKLGAEVVPGTPSLLPLGPSRSLLHAALAQF